MIEELVVSLKEDPEVYQGWQANIAMSFYDAFQNSDKKYRVAKKDIHSIANEAAKNFLNLLTADND